MSFVRFSIKPPGHSEAKMATVAGQVEKKQTRNRKLSSRMVFIYAGGDPIPVQAHHNIVLQSSLFLKNALNSSFRESSGTIKLPEQRKALLEIYVEWLYFGTIDRSDPQIQTENANAVRFGELFDLYLLADVLQDQKFANSVMDVLLRETDAVQQWPTGLAASAWSNLPACSPMRTYIKELWVARSFTEWFGHKSGDIIDAPKEFWIEVAQLYTMMREKKEKGLKPAWVNRCRYHFHNEGQVCN